ncbi:uncharacterized protein LOC106084616 [Stomoxys calcitrans]|uniref:uncharacterized protein LOC106084616 n=1 Tax=Stomoxys calcitrans TaxID=35570 RepID=UPI0027E2C99E|nr:uncharacterized protein LOC106084616 [Stomoxys calcitrans]
MRIFIILCVVAVAWAQAGYKYNVGGGSSGGGSFGSSGGSSSGDSYGSSSGGSFGGSGSSYAGSGGVNVGSGSSSGGSLGGTGHSSVGSFGSSGSSSGGSFAGSSHSSGGSSSGSGYSSGGSFGGSGHSSVGSFGGSGSSSEGSFGGSGLSGGSFGGSGSSSGGSFGRTAGSDSGDAVLEKQFYTFTADEQDFNEPAVANQVSSSFKQGLRVIFIKGPESSGSEKAALALAKNAAEQKTVIYVLNKQADLASLSNQLKSENSNTINKPEVHFVKYRTEEDVNNARKAIEAQYDALGGKTQHFDGGVAKSLNFASNAPGASGGRPGSSGGAPSDTYLPTA